MVSLNASLATQFDEAASQQGSKRPAKKPRTVLGASSPCQEPVEDEDGAAARASRESAARLSAEAEIRQEAEQRLVSETAKSEEREAMVQSVKAQVSSPIYYLH